MKLFKIIALIIATASLTACADKKEEKKSPSIQQAPAKKKDDKTTITISGDSVGVSTRRGDKVEVSKDGAGVENSDVKVKVKKKKDQ